MAAARDDQQYPIVTIDDRQFLVDEPNELVRETAKPRSIITFWELVEYAHSFPYASEQDRQIISKALGRRQLLHAYSAQSEILRDKSLDRLTKHLDRLPAVETLMARHYRLAQNRTRLLSVLEVAADRAPHDPLRNPTINTTIFKIIRTDNLHHRIAKRAEHILSQPPPAPRESSFTVALRLAAAEARTKQMPTQNNDRSPRQAHQERD